MTGIGPGGGGDGAELLGNVKGAGAAEERDPPLGAAGALGAVGAGRQFPWAT